MQAICEAAAACSHAQARATHPQVSTHAPRGPYVQPLLRHVACLGVQDNRQATPSHANMARRAGARDPCKAGAWACGGSPPPRHPGSHHDHTCPHSKHTRKSRRGWHVTKLLFRALLVASAGVPRRAQLWTRGTGSFAPSQRWWLPPLVVPVLRVVVSMPSTQRGCFDGQTYKTRAPT